MRPDRSFVASTSLHAVVLGIGLVTFDARPMVVAPTESMPVDIMSMSEFSQLTRGQKTAPKAEKPKHVAEKTGEVKPPDTETKKIADKTIDSVTPPPPPPKVERPPEPDKKADAKPEPEPKKAEAKPEAKPEPKKAEPKPEIKPDAEALEKLIEKAEKTDKKPEPQKKAEVKPPPMPPKPVDRPKRPPPPPPVAQTPPDPNSKFDTSKIAALLDKHAPQRIAASGAEVSHTASLGSVTGQAQQLSQTEIDALRAQIKRCWNPPVGVAEARDLIVSVWIALNQDGTLAMQPVLKSRGAGMPFPDRCGGRAARHPQVRALHHARRKVRGMA